MSQNADSVWESLALQSSLQFWNSQSHTRVKSGKYLGWSKYIINVLARNSWTASVSQSQHDAEVQASSDEQPTIILPVFPSEQHPYDQKNTSALPSFGVRTVPLPSWATDFQCHHSGTCNDQPEEHPRREVPPVFLKSETPTDQVCSCARRPPQNLTATLHIQ